MLEVFNNKSAFLKIKPKVGFILVIFMTSILLILIIYMFNTQVYDNLSTKGIISCENECQVITAVPSNIDFDKLKINKEEVLWELIGKELMVDEDNYLSYYTLTLIVEEEFNDKEIVDIDFYYNKQRIITKFIKKIF